MSEMQPTQHIHALYPFEAGRHQCDTSCTALLATSTWTSSRRPRRTQHALTRLRNETDCEPSQRGFPQPARSLSLSLRGRAHEGRGFRLEMRRLLGVGHQGRRRDLWHLPERL